MKRPIVIVGIGEMGELFADGLLKSGHPVYPVLRDMALASMAFICHPGTRTGIGGRRGKRIAPRDGIHA